MSWRYQCDDDGILFCGECDNALHVCTCDHHEDNVDDDDDDDYYDDDPDDED